MTDPKRTTKTEPPPGCSVHETCERCGECYMEIWSIEDEDWAKLPTPWNDGELLCLRCFGELGGRPVHGFTYLEINGCVFADRIGQGTWESPERTPLLPIYFIRLFDRDWLNEVACCLARGEAGPEDGRATSNNPQVIDGPNLSIRKIE